MMLRKSTVAALSILVAVATAHPYSSEWNNAARYRWNDLFAARGQDVGARVRSQASVELSSCALVTETTLMNGKTHRMRVCSADPEDFPNKVCLGTRVAPCCPLNLEFGNLVSSTTVSVAEEDVTVNYYLTQGGTGICYRLDDAHLGLTTCSQSIPLGKEVPRACLPDCITVDPTCFNNTLTGDISSCDGSVCQCKTGYLPPDCCQCDTTNFYLPDCRPFCRGNCHGFRPANRGGCDNCSAGFTGAPECCQCEPGKTEVNGVCKPESCDKQQQLFFYIDATSSNTFENFCPLMVVMQMLVAAFNPSSTSGTQIASLLFSDNANNKEPSDVFNMSTSCFNAVQNLSSLITDFSVCLKSGRVYDSTLFPSSCGEGTSAVKGLQEILSLASNSTRRSAEGAIVMITDGIIMDDGSNRTEVLNSLKSSGISTLIAAGIDGADEINLRSYTSRDNILVRTDPVQLGIDIVNKMKERDIICRDHADNIIRSLKESNGSTGGNSIDLFCRCHRKEYVTLPNCQRKYPTCGGSLSFGLPNYQSSGSARARTQNNDALEYMNQLLIEEEILAAIEKVLEQRHHG